MRGSFARAARGPIPNQTTSAAFTTRSPFSDKRRWQPNFNAIVRSSRWLHESASQPRHSPMRHEGRLLRHRRWYATLLRLYPKPFRERFGESMEQTFYDACRANASSGRGFFPLALWLYADTVGGIMSEHLRLLFVRHRTIARPALITACFLLIPLWGTFYVDGWNWGVRGFMAIGSFVFGAALAFELAVKGKSNKAYRFAMG